MKNKNEPILGLADIAGKPINFCFENYCATFMSVDRSYINLDGEFIFGRTINGRDVAIYKGETTITFCGAHRLNTNAYIISTGNMRLTDTSTFDCIEFRGGTLSKVFFCQALKRVETHSSTRFCYDVKEDCERFEFEAEGHKCEVIIGSAIAEHFGIDGVAVSNNDVRLILKFSEPQCLIKAFEHIGKIKDMLSIMTFRKNVGFDEIYIHHGNQLGISSQVFIMENKQFTKKHMMENIGIQALREALPQLLFTIYNTKDRKPSYEIGFLPFSDKDVYLIDNNKVRMICSALECELSFIDDICPKEETDLQGLIKNVKHIVKAHRKSPHKLSSKTYDLIFSSISNWSRSASEKFCELYHRYEEEMINLNFSEVDISDEDISQFVKYRNNITHGSFRVMDSSIATTAYILSGLIYCALLSRIGVSREKILYLCKNRQLLR